MHNNHYFSYISINKGLNNRYIIIYDYNIILKIKTNNLIK